MAEYISRKDALDIVEFECGEWSGLARTIVEAINNLPSARPERTCVNCGRAVNNGGWYADGRTRCPIEEHYALPKDGYCHLWEKRNITDDDYPERRTGTSRITIIQKGEPMSDLISRQAAIDAVFSLCEDCDSDYCGSCRVNYPGEKDVIKVIRNLSPAQPETAKRIVGKSRDGMTLWYQCDMCNEPVNAQDNFCSGCGRRLTDG